MNVKEAIRARCSTRAFLTTPVEQEKLTSVFETAARAPSWANSQPWEVFVATGNSLERIKQGFREKFAAKEPTAPETPRPREWTEAAKLRQQALRPAMVRDCGDAADQFGLLNQSMFYAPAVIFVCMDRVLSEWSLYDIGAYSQTLMLAAEDEGLATIPAISLVLYPDVIRDELSIPDNLKLTIGIAIGYPDKEHKINNFKSSRTPPSVNVRYFS